MVSQPPPSRVWPSSSPQKMSLTDSQLNSIFDTAVPSAQVNSAMAKTMAKLAALPQTKPPSRIMVKSHSYTINGSHGWKVYYLCSHSRSGSGCTAKYHLDRKTDTGEIKGTHVCQEIKMVGNVVMINEEMKKFIAENIYDYAGKPPYVAAISIYNHFVSKYEGQAISNPLRIDQIQTLVTRTRNGEAQGDLKLTCAGIHFLRG